MRIENKTEIDDNMVRALLTFAAKSVKCNHDNVLVKINRGRGGWGAGVRGIAINHWFEPKTIRLTIPLVVNCCYSDEINLVKSVYRVAQHEFAHIKDYKEGTYKQSPVKNGRRQHHDKRPCEIYANTAVMFAKKYDLDDLILEIALQIENAHRKSIR